MSSDKQANVVMRNGSTHEFGSALQYYRDFKHLEQVAPEALRKLCNRVFLTPNAELTEEHKALLIDAGLANRTLSRGLVELIKPEAEIKRFLRLCVDTIPLSGLFRSLVGKEGPSYYVVRPFLFDTEDGRPQHHDNYTPMIF